jgi:hypothetical protein
LRPPVYLCVQRAHKRISASHAFLIIANNVTNIVNDANYYEMQRGQLKIARKKKREIPGNSAMYELQYKCAFDLPTRLHAARRGAAATPPEPPTRRGDSSILAFTPVARINVGRIDRKIKEYRHRQSGFVHNLLIYLNNNRGMYSNI